MTKEEAIKEAVKAIAGNDRTIVALAKVTAVDEENAVISAEIGPGLVIEDVRLRATINGLMGLVIFPAVDSMVYLLRLADSDEFTVASFSAVDKVKFTSENTQFEVNNDGIIFNEAALGSFMPDINNLVSKINALESDLNSLKTVMGTTWVTVPQDGGAALKIAAATWAAQTITPTQVNDIRDEKIQN